MATVNKNFKVKNGIEANDASTIVVNSSSPALRITQTGTGESFRVEDSANPDSSPFVINQDGNVGIGTSSPINSLVVYNGNGVIDLVRFVNNTGTGPTIVTRKSASATVGTQASMSNGEVVGRVIFQGSDGTNFIDTASIIASVDGAPSTNDMPGRLTFSTTSDGATSTTERMRITSSGDVGIGTSSPASKLHITGTASASVDEIPVIIEVLGGQIGDTSSVEFRSNSYKTGAIKSVTELAYISNLQFYTAGSTNVLSERMRITSSGNVGIGTTSPTQRLSVSGNISATGELIASTVRAKNVNDLLSEAVLYIDAQRAGDSQTVPNLGYAGNQLNGRLGSTVAAGGDANDPKYLEWTGSNYIYLPGAADNYMTVPDEANLDITGDIDIRVYAALDNWGTTNATLISKSGVGSNFTWRLYVTNTSRNLTFAYSANGTSETFASSTVGTAIANGVAKWVRVTLDVDNGAGGRDVTFYLSEDGVTWTQLGTTITVAGTISLATNNAAVHLGSWVFNTGNISGKFYRAQIYSGINGTLVLDADTSKIASATSTTFEARTGQTVSIFRGASGRKTVCVTNASWLLGSNDYIEFADNDLFDFSASDSFSFVVIARQWDTIANNGAHISKWDGTSNSGFVYRIQTGNVGPRGYNAAIYDGTNNVQAFSPLTTNQSDLRVESFTLNRTASSAIAYMNGTAGTAVSTSSLGAVSNALPLRIGAYSSGDIGYQDFELIATLVFRKALSQEEVSLITNYFLNRQPKDIEQTIVQNIDSYAAAKFGGRLNEYRFDNGIHIGLGPADNTPRIMFVPANAVDSTTNWQIDVTNNGTFRWFTPGVSQLQLNNRGLFIGTDPITGANFVTSSTASTNIASIIRGAAAQTANLTEWRNSGNTVLASVNKDGNISTTANVTSSAGTLDQSIQFGAAGSVLDNLPTRVHPAENILKEAVWWIDSAHLSANGQSIENLGWGGSALNAQLGSTTGTDSNDPKYLSWNGENYIYMPGVTGNYLGVPDSTELDITGDIDIRAKVQMDDWTPSGNQWFLAKWRDALGYSYGLGIVAGGNLRFLWSPDGAYSGTYDRQSTVATNLPDESEIWVRATLDVNNGSSNYDLKFYTSLDGITWTQLGATVNGTAITSIHSGSSPVNIGTINNAAFGEVLSGKIYRAQIFSGINGTPVLDVDTSLVSSGSATSFRARTGQTVTINRSTSGRKTAAVTHPCWLFGTDDHIVVFDNALIDFDETASFTVIAVARQWPTIGIAMPFIHKTNGSPDFTGYSLRQNYQNNTPRINFVAGTAGAQSDNAGTLNYSLPRYGLVAGVLDRTANKNTIYELGVATSEISVGTTGSSVNSQNLYVGVQAFGGNNTDMEFFAGAIFRRALSASEIALINNYFQARAV